MATGENNFAHLQNLAGGTDLRREQRRKNPCTGCYYYGGKAETVKCCNYYLITGRRRPCDAGLECTVRKDCTRVGRRAMTVKEP
jgi:hypothetical protein